MSPAAILGHITAHGDGSAITLTFHAHPLATYQLRSKRRLSDAWTDGPTGQTDGAGVIRSSDPINSASAFYQLFQRQ